MHRNAFSNYKVNKYNLGQIKADGIERDIGLYNCISFKTTLSVLCWMKKSVLIADIGREV